MPNDNLRNYIHLHFIVFVWGFTAILGKLISLQALDLVWYRMLFAVIFIAIAVYFKKKSFRISPRTFAGFMLSGIVIAGHWLLFYLSIKIANISITLACLSTGAFFVTILEPIIYRKKMVLYEVLFGLIVIIGLSIIFKVESQFKLGIILSLLCAFLSALLSVINGFYAKKFDPYIVSVYQLGGGWFFLTLYLLISGGFSVSFFNISANDLIWLLVLASVCTAYAYAASIKVMQFLSPFTVMLTINLEPIYGIILALFIFNDQEKMSAEFYFGAGIILSTVILNGMIKNHKKI